MTFIDYINKAEFDKCLKEMSNNSSLNRYEKGLTIALIYRYQGLMQKAIEHLEELYRDKSENDLYNLQVSLLLLFCYFEEKKSARFISDVRSYITFLRTQINEKDLGHYWQAIFEYTEAKIHESNNKLYDTIQSYVKAVKHLEKQPNKYELQKGYFLLGSSYRSYGDFFKAQENLEKCLKLVPKSDDLTKARYSNYLAEIYFQRFNTTYKKPLEYLQQSLENWNNLQKQPDRKITIHNLGLVNYLSGSATQAFTYLNEYYESIREEISIQDNVKNFLTLIELLSEMRESSETKKYVEKLENYINFDLLYEDELQLARAFFVRESQTLSYQIDSLKVFNKLTEKNKSDYEMKLKSLLNHLDLLLVELKFAQTNEVLTITDGLVKQIIDYSEKSFEILVQTFVLIETFKSLREDKNQDIPFNAITLKEINPILHSLPIILIVLYILPRKGVTFDDLKEVSELPKEKISEALAQLLKSSFINSEELFIQEKLVETYNMTEDGIREFEMYVKSLTEIIQGFFVG